MKLLSRVERNQRNIRRALPDATIRSKTHSNNSWSEPKASSHAVHRMVKRAPSVSRFLGIREYPWFIDAQRASCIFVVQKYTRVVVVFYRFTDSIARRSHKSTFRDRYPVIDATCVHRDFNDEGKRCVASLRAGFTSRQCTLVTNLMSADVCSVSWYAVSQGMRDSSWVVWIIGNIIRCHDFSYSFFFLSCDIFQSNPE